MINRFGIEIRRGDLISFHTARGEVRCHFVRRFSRVSGYGRRIETAAGSCGVDDVIKATRPRDLIRPGCRIEIGTGKPGCRWVQGWQVRDLENFSAWSFEMRRADALAELRRMRAE